MTTEAWMAYGLVYWDRKDGLKDGLQMFLKAPAAMEKLGS
jgi:hypothetical protein